MNRIIFALMMVLAALSTSVVSETLPEASLKKAGTPTMGGLMILISAGISVLLWADLTNPYIWIIGSVILLFGLIGVVWTPEMFFIFKC